MKYSFVLASTSPRRKELFARIVGDFAAVTPECAEDCDISDPYAVVTVNAERKARSVSCGGSATVIIGSDTVVALDGEILGKPTSADNARKMLRRLSGREHSVYTGVCVICGESADVFCEVSRVYFRTLTDKEITDYVDGGSPMDKAGAYGIQDSGFVSHIEGSYTNIVGLPVEALSEHIKKYLEE